MRFPSLYVLILIGDLIARYFQPTFPYLEWLFKPALMISMAFYFYRETNALSGGRTDKLILFAIAFSLLGDISLMFEGQFITGLLFFLTAHICYIMAFLSQNKGILFVKIDRVGWALLAVASGLGFYGYLIPFLGGMLIPVGIYTSIIVTMFLTALNRWKNVNSDSFQWVLSGAILFMASDGLLAFNMFAQKLPLASYFIMITYALGQYMIVIGYLKSRV